MKTHVLGEKAALRLRKRKYASSDHWWMPYAALLCGFLEMANCWYVYVYAWLLLSYIVSSAMPHLRLSLRSVLNHFLNRVPCILTFIPRGLIMSFGAFKYHTLPSLASRTDTEIGLIAAATNALDLAAHCAGRRCTGWRNALRGSDIPRRFFAPPIGTLSLRCACSVAASRS